MKRDRTTNRFSFVISKILSRRTGLALLGIVVFAVATLPAQHAQSGQSGQSAAPPASQPSSGEAAPAESADQPQSLAEAARQANAQKNKPKAKRVYTEDNLGSIHGNISVVGDKSSSSSGDNSDSRQTSSAGAPASDNNNEAYWRGRARAIKDQIASTDQQIENVKAEIAKSGAASFDPSSGLAQGVIVIHDRNAEVKELEDRKQSLERQLDDLADEARKAGADSGWVR